MAMHLPVLNGPPVTSMRPVPASLSAKKTSTTFPKTSGSSAFNASTHKQISVASGLGLLAGLWMKSNGKPPSLLKAFENELGVQAPVGFWDPAGYTLDGNAEAFTRRRETELKHGRVAMIATLGYIVPEFARFPGALSPSKGLNFTDVPNGLAAISKVPGAGWLHIFLFCGFMETAWIPYDEARGPGDRERCGPLGVPNAASAMANAEERNKKLSAELANGRLAMMAIIGMFFQDGLTGSAWGDWASYTNSPLRAFENERGVLAAGTVPAASRKKTQTSMRFFGDSPSSPRGFDPANELGVQDPVGFWDPLGFAADKDEAAFKRRRAVEIKHGRISMYATIGYIVPEYFKFPGYLSPSEGIKFEDVPNGLAALSKLPLLGGAQIIAFAGLIETTGFFQAESTTGGRGPRGEGQFSMMDSTETGEPGNYGVGFPNFIGKVDDPEARKSKLAAELANGRLAMVAIIGMFFQDGLTGSAWGDWASYTASPLRAFENELGVQEPLGFWDPAGFTSDGDMSKFRRRRSVELKHGRICMLATMGYITPEVIGKLPGSLSPSAGLQFSDIPNGLAAISKVPNIGWAQIAAYFGFCEFSGGFTDYKTGTPGDYGWKVLTSGDPAEKTRKLSAEIANGRLAMVAIIGMFFQDGLTGSAWGDWATYTASPLRAFENELGVQAPVGFWDPAGFCQNGDGAAFQRRRATEIKHGRVSMIACIGYIVPEYAKWPGFLSPSREIQFEDVPNGLQACSKVPGVGWFQILVFGAFIEKSLFVADDTRPPGDFKNAGVLGVPNGSSLTDPEEKTKKLNAELANGRLAMMAIIGMFFQDGLTGSAWGDWASYTDSPLRAFENELGVQAPVGFWDPLGYTADGNIEAFARRRQTELKHGRIAMLATMGYITPEITGKFSGFLSPSTNLKFADIPNGLAAVSKVPAAGWTQMIAYCAYCEISQDQSPGTQASKGEFGFTVLTSSDPAEKSKKLSAEIANGRLAMMAIIGMFFQDGLTGSAWGDWASYTDSPLRAFENELGVQAPVGFWDPAGLSKDGNADQFARRRETELKHGRVAMLASIGYITPEFFKFGGYLSPTSRLEFQEIPSGLAALGKVPGAGWAQIIIFCGIREITWGFEAYKKGKNPGDYGWKAITSSDPETLNRKLNAELANGRLAMMAIMGMFFQDGLTGQAWGDWSLYGDSPLRAEPVSAAAAAAAASALAAGSAKAATATVAAVAYAGKGKVGDDETSGLPFGPGPFDPAKQVGALPPLGYWDPAGFTKDEASFRQYRTAELKHGRVAMMAALGLVTAHSYHFDWIPKTAPAGWHALVECPEAGQGLAVLFFVAGYYELVLWKEDSTKAPGDFGDPAGWALTFPTVVYDSELRNKEMNNGRFAMLAVIGILTAEAARDLDPVDQINFAVQRWGQLGGFENF